jgi:hypothetical protein
MAEYCEGGKMARANLPDKLRSERYKCEALENTRRIGLKSRSK